ncbi:Family with sequence similarity 26, member E [Desmophyllum pertusum]|uniref:Family with sequence similarity 26, member E n=1 Tax=Desmophyllum pertusum TaxID=174260 RepID=A0A9W9YLZ6_9CNID|nr:Family with sequence similarity 26, member E [Desmophyllum pertusum]
MTSVRHTCIYSPCKVQLFRTYFKHNQIYSAARGSVHINMNALFSSAAILFRNSKRSLLYGSMAVLTIGLEELIESVVFNCPCEGHFAYGLAFLWAPALLLFLAGILVDRDLWKLSRISNKEKTQTPAYRYVKTLLATLHVFIRAGIAPVAWLVLSFLQQQYYTCAYFGPLLTSDVTESNTTDKCHFKLGSRSRELEESYKTYSQIVGWSLMLIAVSVLFASVCIRRCIRKAKHLTIPSLEYYRHVEAKEALAHFHATAKEIAKRTLNRA